MSIFFIVSHKPIQTHKTTPPPPSARMLFYLLRNIRQPCRRYCTDSKSHPKPPTSSSEQPAHPRSLLAGIINLLTYEADPGIQADAATCLTELFHDKDLFFTANPTDKEARQLTPEQCKDKQGRRRRHDTTVRVVRGVDRKILPRQCNMFGGTRLVFATAILFVGQTSVLVDIHLFHFDCCFRLVLGPE